MKIICCVVFAAVVLALHTSCVAAAPAAECAASNAFFTRPEDAATCFAQWRKNGLAQASTKRHGAVSHADGTGPVVISTTVVGDVSTTCRKINYENTPAAQYLYDEPTARFIYDADPTITKFTGALSFLAATAGGNLPLKFSAIPSPPTVGGWILANSPYKVQFTGGCDSISLQYLPIRTFSGKVTIRYFDNSDNVLFEEVTDNNGLDGEFTNQTPSDGFKYWFASSFTSTNGLINKVQISTEKNIGVFLGVLVDDVTCCLSTTVGPPPPPPPPPPTGDCELFAASETCESVEAKSASKTACLTFDDSTPCTGAASQGSACP